MDRTEYDLLKPEVFESLREFDWFEKAISLQYREIARVYGCVPVMSHERLIQAHDIFWNDADNGRDRHMPRGTESLDQFKLCAYLCFWLRRINPVREIRPIKALAERERWLSGGARLDRYAENFILYGNEIAAITIAVRLVQYLNLVVVGSDPVTPAIGRYALVRIDADTTIEYAKILKHKNISAHGLNMALQMLCRIGQVLERPGPG
jgi:hypothetical protein